MVIKDGSWIDARTLHKELGVGIAGGNNVTIRWETGLLLDFVEFWDFDN